MDALGWYHYLEQTDCELTEMKAVALYGEISVMVARSVY